MISSIIIQMISSQTFHEWCRRVLDYQKNYLFLVQVLHIFKRKITVTRHYIFSVPGNQPAKIYPKVKQILEY